MSRKKRALVIVEGAATEPRLLGRRDAESGLLPFMEISDYEITEFKNPIYELYRKYKDGMYNDLVAFLVSEGKLTLEEGETSRTAFSAVYLIFDFDPQYHMYRDEDLLEMLEIFDNETELGKLYINYPMVEACTHINSLPDPGFLERKISMSGLSSESYKRLVRSEGCLRRINKEAFRHIIRYNYNKAKSLDESLGLDVDHMMILKRQIEEKNATGEFYVLGLLPMVAIDYNFDLTLEKYNLQLVGNGDMPNIELL